MRHSSGTGNISGPRIYLTDSQLHRTTSKQARTILPWYGKRK